MWPNFIGYNPTHQSKCSINLKNNYQYVLVKNPTVLLSLMNTELEVMSEYVYVPFWSIYEHQTQVKMYCNWCTSVPQQCSSGKFQSS